MPLSTYWSLIFIVTSLPFNLTKAQLKVLEEIDLERSMDEAFEVKETKQLNESFERHITKENRNHRAKLDHSEDDHTKKVYQENFDNLCKDLFFYIVFESLLIDNDIKALNDLYFKNNR